MSQQTINIIDPTEGMTEAQLVELNAGMDEQEKAMTAHKALDAVLTEKLDDLSYTLRDSIESLINSRASALRWQGGRKDVAPVSDRNYRQQVMEVVEQFLTDFPVEKVTEMSETKMAWDKGSERFLSALARRKVA